MHDPCKTLKTPDLAQPILGDIQIFQLAPFCSTQVEDVDPVGPNADFAQAVEVFDT